MKPVKEGKRVGAEEAAEILGVPARQISRLDIEGRFIQRFKVTRKTHVYDVESLYLYLEASRVAPINSGVGHKRAQPMNSPKKFSLGAKEPYSLREFLKPNQKQAR
jgi:hypothetical protein